MVTKSWLQSVPRKKPLNWPCGIRCKWGFLISMAWCKTVPRPTHWGYGSLALNHWYDWSGDFLPEFAINSYHHYVHLHHTHGHYHHSDVIMAAMASQNAGVSVICLTVCSGEDQRKHHSSTSLTFVRGIHWWPVNTHHKGPVTRKMFPFDDVTMIIK